jgi:glycolate oxidase FAD binding subunit
MTALDELVKIVRSEFPDDRLTWQKGIATFHPESAGEVSQVFRHANRIGAEAFITGFGNNIDPTGPSFETRLSIRSDRLNQLIRIEPEDFYVEVGSGYPLREINRALKDARLYMPHGDLSYVGSMGGAVAVGLTATVNDYLLPIRKYLIKAQIVIPTGDIITPGSVCFKSVSGYDIVKIFCPSWGLLGFLATLTIRVLPDSARHEYASMRMNAISRGRFLSGLDDANTDTDAVYARKVKSKFDPGQVLPIV